MQKHDPTPYDAEAVHQLLVAAYGAVLDATAIQALQQQIEPFVRRTTKPLVEIVPVIADHYRRERERLRLLLDDTDPQAWEAVLQQVIHFASRHHLYPTDAEATSWPDIEAYEDIRHKLAGYNCEGTLDSWIRSIVVSRLRRFWRDQQAQRVGGTGFLSRTARAEAQATGQAAPPPRSQQQSLDAVSDGGAALGETLAADELPVDVHAENDALQRLVIHEVGAFAAQRDDPLLVVVWQLVGMHQWKLREAAAYAGLSIGQVHRRVEQVRTHLQLNPCLQHWINPGD